MRIFMIEKDREEQKLFYDPDQAIIDGKWDDEPSYDMQKSESYFFDQEEQAIFNSKHLKLRQKTKKKANINKSNNSESSCVKDQNSQEAKKIFGFDEYANNIFFTKNHNNMGIDLSFLNQPQDSLFVKLQASQQNFQEKANEQFYKISHLSLNDQHNFIEKQVYFYQGMMRMLLTKHPQLYSPKNPLHRELVADGARNKKDKSRYELNNANANNPPPNKASRKKRFMMTPKLLAILAKKFEIFKAGKQGNYDPQYRLTMSAISKQFRIGTSSIYRLYNDWQTDPTFRQKLSNVIVVKDEDLPMVSYSEYVLDNQNDPIERYFRERKQLQGSTKIEKGNNMQCKKSQPEQEETIQQKNSIKTLGVRQTYCSFFRKLQEKEQIYFLGETTSKDLLNLSDTKLEENPFTLTVVFSITGHASWGFTSQSVPKEQKIISIVNLIKSVKQQKQEQSTTIYLVADSAFSKETAMQNVLKDIVGAKMVFLPRFSQKLNPLEFWFRQIRLIVQGLKISTIDDIKTILKRFSSADFESYLKEMEAYVDKGVKKEPF